MEQFTAADGKLRNQADLWLKFKEWYDEQPEMAGKGWPWPKPQEANDMTLLLRDGDGDRWKFLQRQNGNCLTTEGRRAKEAREKAAKARKVPLKKRPRAPPVDDDDESEVY